jgi:hypothetical protein
LEKEFNITGTCIPEMHYMIDTSIKLDKIIDLIERGKYFIINRPRQYGKTTTLYLLDKKLRTMDKYLSIKISFESIDTESYKEAKLFLRSVMKQIKNYFRFSGNKNMYDYIEKVNDKIDTMDAFSDFVTDMVEYTNKRIVLIIDEVDKSSNNQLFLDFLGMLRNKYLLKNQGEDYTFHSVILAGVHDVKSLKAKIRPEDEKKYNSPWNIASDFDVDMSFSKDEIGTMLDDYIENKGVTLDKDYFSERLHFYTSGYPFLVSKLCKIIDEKIMDRDELIWKNEYMDKAVKELLKESNTNFDSLIKNIENNKELRQLIKRLIIDGSAIIYNKDNPIILLGITYGIFKNEDGKLKIHNRIYEQRVYDYLSSLIEVSTDLSFYNEKSKFINSDGTLDIRKVLIKFQEFMKHEHSEKREAFLEADGRLLFLAFLSPIINGVGFAFKEVQGGEEKRFDIVITYEKKVYILELKIWHGEEYNNKGLQQLGEYLEQYNLDEGYLLIFDFRKKESLSGTVNDKNVIVGNKNKKVLEVYC